MNDSTLSERDATELPTAKAGSSAAPCSAICADDVRDSMPLFRSGRGGSIPTSALHLHFRETSVRRAIELNRIWHSRMPEANLQNMLWGGRSVAYEAELDEICYAAAIWSAPIAANRLKDGDRSLELRRMAIADDAPKNTATRMIGWMTRDIRKRFPELVKLVSYQDTAVHSGTIYKAAGWVAAYTGKYVDWKTHKDSRKAYGLEQSDAPKVRWEFSLQNS